MFAMRCRLPRLLVPAVLAGCAAACGSTQRYDEEFGEVYRSYQRGDFPATARLIQEGYKKRWQIDFDADGGTMHFSDDAVLWNLERGKILLDAGRYQAAGEALEQAETVINQGFGERAVISARDTADEAGALLTNQKGLPYRGYVHDRILLNCYKALAAALGGDLEQALVEARRIDDTQAEAVRRFSAAAEAADREGAGKGLRLDYSAFASEPRVREDLPWLQGADAYPPSYQGFVNPFATLVKAVLRRIANDPNETAEVDWRNLAGMLPDQQQVREELQRVQERVRPSGWVYLIFENGLAPTVESVEIRVPYGFWRAVFGRGTNEGSDLLDHAFFALPALRSGRRPPTALVAADDGGRADRSERVADMETVMRYEFERRYPAVLLREALRVLVQETAGNEIEKVAKRQDEILGVLAKVGTLIYKSAVNLADDRSWRTVGAEFQFLARPIPAGGRLTLRLDDGGATPYTVELGDADVALIYARSVGAGQLVVHQATFHYGIGGIEP